MLIAARNAMMAGGKRLPYDAEVEFLESTGTQYIDTGIRGAGSGYLAATFQPLNVGSSSTYWRYFGASNGATKTDRTIAYNANGRTIFENGYNLVVLGTSRGDIYTIQKTGYNVPSGSTIGDNNFQIFGYNGTTNLGNVRFYSFSLWDSNDTLVRDFIPVRKGTVGYLYDRVSGKLFGNAGTGDFVLGPDVVPVEYIESSGTQHINTGIVPYPDMPLDISAYVSSSFPLIDARNYIFGSMRQGPGSTVWRCHLGLSPTDSMAFAGIGEVYANQAYPQLRNAWVRITQSQGKTLSANGIVLASSAESYDANLTAPIWLFGCCVYANYNSTVITGRHGACRIGSAIVGNCSFRPVRVGSGTTWEGAMMDVLTRRIYRNAGTGAFTFGNDLKHPIPAA